MIRIHNTETDEVLDREMTLAEFKEHQAATTAYEAEQAEVESKATARAAILDRLGLTAEEAAILLG